MKKIVFALLLIALGACKASDKEIKADIAAKAQQDLNFCDLSYTVNNGIATFYGSCPSKSAFEKIKKTVSSIHVLKGVEYQVFIRPVLLDELTPLKLRADSVLAAYPLAIAQVSSSAITLRGSADAASRQQLLQALRLKYPGVIKDSLNLN